jgi:TolB-like protein/tetratricopeptide (TPR) repeat protein
MFGQMPDGALPRELSPGDQIGRYQILRPLGRGGMGVVYVARDHRLDRDVALKMIAGLADETARSRFWREARAAASVSHPNVCQVFEVDESGDGIFLTMELLEGEPLDRKLMRGALPPKEAMPIALAMLSALEALHARSVVHRDIKPSNVFITHHGPKLLDFGLARPVVQAASAGAGVTPATQAGMIIGTPQYMAPEQVTGAFVDGRTDLYSVGAVIFQMLAGRPPFTGTPGDVLFAALKENPPALQGPSEVIAIDRVIRRAMRKDPIERYSCAADMTAELSSISLSGTHAGPAMPVRALTRVVVAPLRLAKTDPDVSYLQFGLAEAVSGSLATLGNIVVRAPAVAAKWSDENGDPRQLAAAADVDLVMSSTLLRSGAQLRITTQLIDASSGTLMGATTVKGSMDDVFALEDALTNAAMVMLTPQLTVQHRPSPPARRDIPANPRAFELFLRGMEEARTLTGTGAARELFLRAVQEDPQFAPAWAALGRAHRVWGKYYEDRDENNRLAERAFLRALELSPDLPLAHRYYTHFESEYGRAADAIVRLLKHARTNRHDAQLFAGLVHACRYAGLFDASMAAHAEAIRLDPTVSTSVEYTIAQLPGGVERAALLTSPNPGNLDGIFPAMSMGSPADARQVLATVDMSRVPPAYQKSFDAIAAFASGGVEGTIQAVDAAVCAHVDPEALFLFGVMLARIGATARALEIVGIAVTSGYAAAETLKINQAFETMRDQPAFKAIEGQARRRKKDAQQLFEAAGGPEMLGMPAVTRLN